MPEPLWLFADPREVEGLAWGAARRAAVGVGKVAAAIATTERLAELRPELVVIVGIAGAFDPTLAVGSLVIVAGDRFGDEGVDTPEGFVAIEALGMAGAPPLVADPGISTRLVAHLGAPAVAGVTVSTCSGTDARALAIAARSGAAIETMEGAAIAWACQRRGVPWVSVRAISNRTGDRPRAGWDLPRARARLIEAAAAILEEGI